MSEYQQTLADLQVVVMEQERTIEQLGELLIDHQAQIDRLQNKIEVLEQRFSRYSEDIEQSDQNEIPPHY